MLRLGTHNKVWDLLSSYIDREASDAENRLVESHLASCDRCTAELDELQSVVGLLRDLPELPAPRSYTLAAAPAEVPIVQRPSWLTWTPRLATATAAVFLAVLLVGDAFDILAQSGTAEIAARVESQITDTAIEESADAPAVARSVAAPEADLAAPPEEAAVAEMAVPEATLAEEEEMAAAAIEAALVAGDAALEDDAPALDIELQQTFAAEVAAAGAADESAEEAVAMAAAEIADESVEEAVEMAAAEIADESAEEAVEMELAAAALPEDAEISALTQTSPLEPSPDDAEELALAKVAPVEEPEEEADLALSAALESGAAAEYRSRPADDDEGVGMPLWQLEVGVGVALALSVVTNVWTARRNARVGRRTED